MKTRFFVLFFIKVTFTLILKITHIPKNIIFQYIIFYHSGKSLFLTLASIDQVVRFFKTPSLFIATDKSFQDISSVFR